MFIIDPIKKENATGELKTLYAMIEKSLGFVPPHFELFAAIDIQALKSFVKHNLYFARHKKIDADLLPFLRLYIAQQECRNYCINFNTKMLLTMNVDEKILHDIVQNIHSIPLSAAQRVLLQKVIKGIYNAEEFSQDDLMALHDAGFSNKDFYELLDYAVHFMGKSKMIEVFSDPSVLISDEKA